MLRVAPIIIELLLLIYCVIDCIQTPDGQVRNLPKVAWIPLIIIVPIAGPIAWFVAGRPRRPGSGLLASWPSGAPAAGGQSRSRALGPDDDPEFLRQIRDGNTEQEKLLKRWEDDLRRREEDLRDQPEDPPGPGSP